MTKKKIFVENIDNPTKTVNIKLLKINSFGTYSHEKFFLEIRVFCIGDNFQ